MLLTNSPLTIFRPEEALGATLLPTPPPPTPANPPSPLAKMLNNFQIVQAMTTKLSDFS